MAAHEEVRRLTAGADPTPVAPYAWPTPGQWIHMWNQQTAERRLEIAERVIADAEAADRCRVFHPAAGHTQARDHTAGEGRATGTGPPQSP